MLEGLKALFRLPVYGLATPSNQAPPERSNERLTTQANGLGCHVWADVYSMHTTVMAITTTLCDETPHAGYMGEIWVLSPLSQESAP